jgi:DNA-binding IclR family transcriptional regulator
MPRPAPQIDRLLALVRLLSADPTRGYGIGEISRRLQVNKANLYPMLATLLDAAWLVRDERTKAFRLGPALVAVGDAAAGSMPAISLAQPALVELSHEWGVTCAILALSDGHATILDQAFDVRSNATPLRVGQRVPVRAPFGAVFIAWSGEAEVRAWLAGEREEARERTERALDVIRRQGFVIELRTGTDEQVRSRIEAIPAGDDRRVTLPAEVLDQLVDELAGEPGFLLGEIDPERRYAVSTIGAPVFDARGDVSLCVTAFGFTAAMTGRELELRGRRLRSVTAELTRKLGGRPAA